MTILSREYTHIIIKDMRLDMFIGVHDFEKEAKQAVLVSIEASIHPSKLWKDDDINKTVNYETIISKVQSISQRGHINLIENFAEQIAEACLQDSNIQTIKIRIEKPDIFSFIHSVSVEILRENNQ